MTRAPQSLRVSRMQSPLGTLLSVCDESGFLRALDFADCEPRMRRLLAAHYGEIAPRCVEGPAPPALERALAAFFAREPRALEDIELRTGGTEFQRRVWAALRRIPFAERRSYGELARELGKPGAARAVGAANAANPIAIVVPCHRVVGTGGALTGYAGGIARKRWLLEHEQGWRTDT